MKNESNLFIARILLGLFLLAAAANISAQTTEFTYQGRLNDGGIVANGNYDLEFRLFDVAAGSSAIGTIQRLGVPVSNGSFTVGLDFGAQFDGAARYLEIAVKLAGSPNPLTTLNPRQPITSAPYAIRARESTTADTATNTNQLGGVPAARFVQSDVNGNVSVGGNLSVGGTLTQSIVNAQTEYQIGGQRILSSPTGTDNLFIGRSAGLNNSGFANTFVGSVAGRENTNGFFNTFLGSSAGLFNTTGAENTFLGSNAGRFNTTGRDNTFVGLGAGYNNSTGQRNSFFGKDAGGNCPSSPCPAPSTGYDNSFFGYQAGANYTSGGNNSFFGTSAGRSTTTGMQNSFFGALAGNANISSDFNSFFGYSSGAANTTGAENTFVGAYAGTYNTLGRFNSFFGRSAGQNNTIGDRNAFFGLGAGASNTTADDNSFFGTSAGATNTEGGNNSFFGKFAGLANTIGGSNTVVGALANVGANNLNFASAFGAGAVVNSNNTVVLGRTLDTVQIPGNLNLSGNFTGSFVIPTVNGGTGLNSPGNVGNFLRSDGANWTSAPFDAADIPNLSITNNKLAANSITADKIADGAVVKKLNNLTDNVTLAAGSNITITPSGNTLTIASTGGGGCGNPCVADIFDANIQYNITGQGILRVNGDGDGDPLPSSISVGFEAGKMNSLAGSENSFFGRQAGRDNVSGAQNAYFGFYAGRLSTGESNAFFGSRSGGESTAGSSNAFFGQFSGFRNSNGNSNSYFGAQAGSDVDTGNNNAFFGDQTGFYTRSGNNNTLIGSFASTSVGVQNLSFATAIGSGSAVSTSNTIALGRTSGADTVRIYGNLVVDGTTSFAAKQTEALEASVKKQDEQIKTQTEQIEKQITQIQIQQKLLVEQQKQIDALRKLVCSTNATAEICKEVK